MTDGTISQDEIDALLSSADMGGLPLGGSSVSIDVPVLQKFEDGIKDKFLDKLNQMTGASFTIAAPVVESSGRDQFLSKLPEEVVAVNADYSTTLTGDHLFVFPVELAQKIVSLVNKEDSAEFDDMALSIVGEFVGQLSGAEITDLSSGGKLPGLAANPPTANKSPKAMIRMPEGSFALFNYQLSLEDQAYSFWEVVSGSVADGMAVSLGGGSAAQAAAAAQSNPVNAMMGGQAQPNPMMGMPQMNPMMGMGGMPNMQQNVNPMMNMPNVQSVQYPNLSGGPSASEQGNIGLIMDVFMEMTVELGRTKKQIKEILGMGEGTIIELDKLAGEPVDILVNHKPIAKGEVVVIDENFGVRVTEILSPMERVSDMH
ncbi:MAG: flagellar motor switch protein FliN [Treponema sp.]|nr:flagellar motor switch protein FliN [Treponema sp.]